MSTPDLPTLDIPAIRAALATGGPLLEAATVQGIPVAATLRALCDALDAEVADGLARTTATVNKLIAAEAALVTARRDALTAAADELDAADLGPFNQQAQWCANRLRARALETGHDTAEPRPCPHPELDGNGECFSCGDVPAGSAEVNP